MSEEWKPTIEGEGPILAAAWAEEFHCFYRFETLEYANGFVDGYGVGAGEYGAGDCSIFVLAGSDLAEMKEYDKDKWEEVKDMLRRVGLSSEVEGA